MSTSDRLDEIEARPVAWPWLDRAEGDKNALLTALRAVLDLHEPDGHDPQDSAICPPCAEYHPCPTVRAITTALGEEA